MNTLTASTPSITRGRIIILALVIAASLSAALPSGLRAAESSPMPEATASLAPAQAACESAADLRLIIDFTRDIDTSVDGWVPVAVGVIAGLSEARQLAGLVDSAYRPLVDDVIVSLQDLQATVGELRDEATVGAKLAAVGEAITDVGNAMDALSIQLQDPCPAGE